MRTQGGATENQGPKLALKPPNAAPIQVQGWAGGPLLRAPAAQGGPGRPSLGAGTDWSSRGGWSTHHCGRVTVQVEGWTLVKWEIPVLLLKSCPRTPFLPDWLGAQGTDPTLATDKEQEGRAGCSWDRCVAWDGPHHFASMNLVPPSSHTHPVARERAMCRAGSGLSLSLLQGLPRRAQASMPHHLPSFFLKTQLPRGRDSCPHRLF